MADCPPLPTITKWPATIEQKRAADAHFKCKMHTGGALTPAKLKAIWLASGQWITEQEKRVFGPPRERRDKPGVFVRPGPPPAIEAKAKAALEASGFLPPQTSASAAEKPATLTTSTAAEKTVTQSTRTAMDPGTLGTVGSLILSRFGKGKSKCAGPYNYDPRTGACVPKPDYAARTGGGGYVPSGGALVRVSGGECQPGYRWDGKRCVEEGVGGFIERILPGGETGTQMDIYGQAVVGSFGMPALVPATVGVIQNARGENKPVRRCPKGAVLGKDDLCYQKGAISRQYRKWPKPTNPKGYISRSDLKALNKIHGLQEKAKNLAMASGFKVTKRR